MSDFDFTKKFPIDKLRIEDGARELASLPDMDPYMQIIQAEMRGGDTTSELEAIRQLPLERRYVWRVAQALKSGFADFDSVSVLQDKKTLSPEDLGKVIDLLKLRPVQLCYLLKALLGADEMERVMRQAIKMAK